MPFASHRTARFPSVTGPFAESPPDRRVIQLATERKTEAHANSKDNSYPAGASTSGPDEQHGGGNAVKGRRNEQEGHQDANPARKRQPTGARGRARSGCSSIHIRSSPRARSGIASHSSNNYANYPPPPRIVYRGRYHKPVPRTSHQLRKRGEDMGAWSTSAAHEARDGHRQPSRAKDDSLAAQSRRRRTDSSKRTRTRFSV